MDNSSKWLNGQGSPKPFYVLGNNAGNLYALVAFHCAGDNMYLGFKCQSVRLDPKMTVTLCMLLLITKFSIFRYKLVGLNVSCKCM